jgi:ribonuclease P protein subunit POP4
VISKLLITFLVKINTMPITAENIVRHELIGLRVRVADSKDPSHAKLSGRIIDESYSMLRIESKKRGDKPKEKSIPKRNSIFIFALPNGVKVKVDGRLLVGRPEDRIKKKFEKW